MNVAARPPYLSSAEVKLKRSFSSFSLWLTLERMQGMDGGVDQMFWCEGYLAFLQSFLPCPSVFPQNMWVNLWQVYSGDCEAVMCLCDAPLCCSLRSQSSWSRWIVNLCLSVRLHTLTHTLLCTQPKKRRTNSVCWEEVQYNQFVRSTQAIIKPDRQLGANSVHHSLFWPARIPDLMYLCL